MPNFKQVIAEAISKAIGIEKDELIESIEIPKEIRQGDYAFPCFRLAKTLKKAPQMIAEDIKEKIELNDDLIEKMEIIGGYLNFFINKKTLAETVVTEIKAKKDEYRKNKYRKWKKHNSRIFFSEYCKTISYRTSKNNINRTCFI